MLMAALFRLIPGIAAVLPNRGFIEFVGFPLDDGDGLLRTFAEAGSKTVAEVISEKHRLAVHYPDRPFRACGDAESATVTFFRVYGYHFSFHFRLLFQPSGCYMICLLINFLWGQNNPKKEPDT
jgi:hypothetical protein